ncbi:MAG: hypothetical protein PVH00_09590 [Gemmatimonadota bacterium]|jgi:hypothetical protein
MTDHDSGAGLGLHDDRLITHIVVSIRWGLLLPVAIAAALATMTLVSLLDRWTFGLLGLDGGSFTARLTGSVLPGVAMVAAFIGAGAGIAPAARRLVVMAFAGIAIVYGVVGMFQGIASRYAWGVVAGFAMAAAAGVVLWFSSVRHARRDRSEPGAPAGGT